MKGFMNTLFLSSSWKVVVQDLSLLKKRKTTDIGTLRAGKPSSMTLNFINDSSKPYGMTSDWGGRTASAGFTLIELLVVVLIIGILAAVAVPQYTKAVEKSRAAGVIQKVKSLQNAVDMYLLANDWPTVQFTNLSGTSGRENLDISFKANATMKRSGLAVSSYMVFDDYYFYVVCERDVCYIIAEDNKPYKEQIVRASWYRYKNYTRYQPMDTWNRGTCKYKSDSSAGKAICEYFKQNSLLSNNNWEISAKS
mgnify:CR=1 FL=1